MFICHPYTFFDVVTVQLFFLDYLFSYCFVELFVCSDNIYIRYVICKCFLLAYGLTSNSLNGVFHRQNIFNMGKIQSYQFFSLWKMLVSKNSLPNTKSHRFSLIFSSRNFIGLYFTFGLFF